MFIGLCVAFVFFSFVPVFIQFAFGMKLEVQYSVVGNINVVVFISVWLFIELVIGIAGGIHKYFSWIQWNDVFDLNIFQLANSIFYTTVHCHINYISLNKFCRILIMISLKIAHYIGICDIFFWMCLFFRFCFFVVFKYYECFIGHISHLNVLIFCTFCSWTRSPRVAFSWTEIQK